MQKVYNFFGQDVTNVEPEYTDRSYCSYDENMHLITNWPKPDDQRDELGFDKTRKDKNGAYKHKVKLPKGTIFCRYGDPRGRTTTTVGTPFSKLGLPYVEATLQYHEYIVTELGKQNGYCVLTGFVAPAFDSKGGGVQHVHEYSIVQALKMGYIKEKKEWIRTRRERKHT